MKQSTVVLEKLSIADSSDFREGINDPQLRKMYGFPSQMENEKITAIFERFCRMDHSFSIRDAENHMIGFLLDVEPELPEKSLAVLKGQGRTLAFSIFPPYQRKGFMEKALRNYIQLLFKDGEVDYIHCGHFYENTASRQLLDKLGFMNYGTHSIKDKIIVDRILYREFVFHEF